MRQNDPINKVMSTDLVTASINDHFSEVKEMMKENCVRHLPIVEGTQLIGIVSQTDILTYSVSKAFVSDDSEESNKVLDPHVTIAEVMTSNPITLKDYDTVKHAIEIFSSQSFHSIPVVDKEHNLVGIVSTDDIMTYFMKQY